MPTAGWWEALVAGIQPTALPCPHPCCFLEQHQAGVETGSEAILTFVPRRAILAGPEGRPQP